MRVRDRRGRHRLIGHPLLRDEALAVARRDRDSLRRPFVGSFVRHRDGTVAFTFVTKADLRDPSPADGMPIKMLNDRILVRLEGRGRARSTGGILIPATAQMAKRLAWAKVVAVGANVRTVEAGDQVLFNPEDRYEVEVRGDDYIILRERDIHAVAAERLDRRHRACTCS